VERGEEVERHRDGDCGEGADHVWCKIAMVERNTDQMMELYKDFILDGWIQMVKAWEQVKQAVHLPR
jgi:hypothetical protein